MLIGVLLLNNVCALISPLPKLNVPRKTKKILASNHWVAVSSRSYFTDKQGQVTANWKGKFKGMNQYKWLNIIKRHPTVRERKLFYSFLIQMDQKHSNVEKNTVSYTMIQNGSTKSGSKKITCCTLIANASYNYYL